MDFDEMLDFAQTSLQYLSDLVVWYLWNITYYPLTALLLAVFLQYVTSYDSKIRFVSCYLVYYLGATVAALFIWPFFVLNARAGVINSLYGAYLLRPIARVLNIEFELRNPQYISAEFGTAVIAANHQSIFDVLGMFTKWHVMRKCTAIARKKVFYVWPFGLVAWIAGVVFIDRVPSNEKTYEKINKAAAYICREKAKLWMFVEGTRNRNPEKLLPFKKGAFRVAICCQVPVVPVVFSPYYFIDGKTMYFGKGKIIMEALEPIPTKGLTLDDIDNLMSRVHKVMSEKNDEFRAMLKNKYKQGKLPFCKNL